MFRPVGHTLREDRAKHIVVTNGIVERVNDNSNELFVDLRCAATGQLSERQWMI